MLDIILASLAKRNESQLQGPFQLLIMEFTMLHATYFDPTKRRLFDVFTFRNSIFKLTCKAWFYIITIIPKIER